MLLFSCLVSCSLNFFDCSLLFIVLRFHQTTGIVGIFRKYFTETLILSDEHKSMLNFSQNKIVTIRWLFRSSFRWYFLLRIDWLSDLSLSLDKHLFNTRMGSCLPYWTCRRVMMMFVDSGDIGVGFWSRFWDRSVVDI